MSREITALAEQVQENCHISDAVHARDYTLCIYLLKMREYFRWEMGYGYTDRLPNDELGRWLTAREDLWHGLEQADFRPLEIGGKSFDPFETDSINAAVDELGVTYSGGFGGGGRPHFFLAERISASTLEGRQVMVVGREYAREITAPPAMLQGNTIFVRRESLKRLLWERLEESQWRRQEGPMARAASFYDFDDDFEAALDRMTDQETETVLLHELGEARAAERLGEEWEAMLADMGRSRTELLARAARDHLADCLVTLPALLEREAFASLHVYVANLSGVRKAIFPELMTAYRRWSEGGGIEPLAKSIEAGCSRWAAITEELLACYRTERDSGSGCFDRLVANYDI